MNISNLIWITPLLSLVLLVLVALKFGRSASKAARQIARLEKQLNSFSVCRTNAAFEQPQTPLTTLGEATKLRKAYIQNRTKAKQERQRRLVKRLSILTSKERE